MMTAASRPFSSSALEEPFEAPRAGVGAELGGANVGDEVGDAEGSALEGAAVEPTSRQQPQSSPQPKGCAAPS